MGQAASLEKCDEEDGNVSRRGRNLWDGKVLRCRVARDVRKGKSIEACREQGAQIVPPTDITSLCQGQ